MTISAPPGVALSQRRFRTLLDALARPGSLERLSDPEPCSVKAAAWPLAAACALLDHEVSFTVAGDGIDSESRAAVARETGRRTGARLVEPESADFVLLFGEAGEALVRFKPGDPAFPDQAATLLWHVDGFGSDTEGKGSTALELLLTGPGIEGSRVLKIAGVSPADLAALSRINQDYPCGLDTFFIDGEGRVAGLPRSTHIVIRGGEN